MPLKNWRVVTPSEFAWEREALEFVRQHLPGGDQVHAWSNFEFISETGTIYEVDLLVLTPYGLFLIEIKSRPGVISGDATTWTWRADGKTYVDDNPLLLANRKAKRLVSLLKKQKASQGVRFPFLEPLVFCSHPTNQLQLQGSARYRVCLRDQAQRKGIVAALSKRDYEGAQETSPPLINQPIVRAVVQAMEQAGIRPSQRFRRVGDYVLGKTLYASPNGTYQDWEATHAQIKGQPRRVRIYNLERQTNETERERLRRAAKREYQLLDALNHPNILPVDSFTEHELGPALVFRHDPHAVRLDHFLAQQSDKLNVDLRLHLLRQIAEALKYAHEKRTVHCALSPQSILVVDGNTNQPKVKIFNWQTGYRDTTASTSAHTTWHPEQFVEDAATVYLAPEILGEQEQRRETLDIFSLGAIAYHIFTGQAPAADRLELLQKLREGKGLQISAVLDGAGRKLQELIQFSTHPEVMMRYDTVNDFLAELDEVENELTAPDSESEIITDPLTAKIGDRLPGGLIVKGRLGSGSSAVAFLVEKDGKEIVLKLAHDAAQNARLREEAETVKKLRHPNIVEAYDVLEVGGLVGYTMQKATTQKAGTQEGEASQPPQKTLDGTLAQRLRAEGRLHLELLERFGTDLLEAVKYLEQFGVHHRDIKPDNIGIRPLGSKGELHLVLFDFSLCNAPLENIRAGTTLYLDPFLSLRKPPRWDLSAERFSAAVTLYEMATGTLPKWGDGNSSPEVLECEATLLTDLFDLNLRAAMTDFFQQALARDYRERFDNAEEMLRAWRHIFEDADKSIASTTEDEAFDAVAAAAKATLTTQVITLGLSTRAANVLDRINVITVQDLLQIKLRRLYRLRGVGSKTRQEITQLFTALRERFPSAEETFQLSPEPATTDTVAEPEVSGTDLIAQQVAGVISSPRAQAERAILHAFLGWDQVGSNAPLAWHSQTEVANRLGLTRARINQVVLKARERWQKNPSVTSLRHTIADIIQASGGAMTLTELCDAVLAARGSSEDEPKRSQLATVIIRAAVETEGAIKAPRFQEWQLHGQRLLACQQDIAEYVEALGRVADQLAELDPLPTPARTLEDLRAVELREGLSPLTDARLVKLAAAGSRTAAVSSKMEIYPRGMAAVRALKLAASALGNYELTVRDIQERVLGRYPEAEKLPDRPALDQVLRAAELELSWQPGAAKGKGAYTFASPANGSGLSSSTTWLRHTTGPQRPHLVEVSPEIAEARVFENKLRRAAQDGAFLALIATPQHLLQAEAEIARRFSVTVQSVDALLIHAMREQARAAGVDWQVVLQADAASPDSGDWRNLMILVGRSLPLVEQQLAASDNTLLLTYPGLLARYGRMDLLERLRDKVGLPGSALHGVWVLLAADGQNLLPVMDGKAVPVIGSAQWARIPEAWIHNEHRTEG